MHDNDAERKRQLEASFIPVGPEVIPNADEQPPYILISDEDEDTETITLRTKNEGDVRGFSPHPSKPLDIIPEFMRYLRDKGYEGKPDPEKGFYTFTRGDSEKPTITCHKAGANGLPEAKITFKDASPDQIREIFVGIKESLEKTHQERYRDAQPPVPFDISGYKINFKAANEEDMQRVKTLCAEMGLGCEGSVKPAGPSAPARPSMPSFPGMPSLPGMGR
jgi:hypothetical protein